MANNQTGALETTTSGHVFMMTGASRHAMARRDVLFRISRASIKTGPNLNRRKISPAHSWPLGRTPYIF